MDWIQALVLGLIQGLTEYLPVSSSGHLTIGQEILGVSSEDNLAFDVVVHVATVLSTLVVLWGEIVWLLKGFFKFKMNEEMRYVINILVSMIPVGIVGVFFKDQVEDIFGSGLLVVGICLLVTAALLTFTYFARPRQKEKIGVKDAFIIGVAQACAVLPGLSRSPPDCCLATRRSGWHSSPSSWSYRPYSVKHCSTCSKWLRARLSSPPSAHCPWWSDS